MAMMVEYKPGMDLTQPWLWSLTSRTNPGFQVGSDGVLKAAAATAVRDSHWYNGVRTTLLEPGSTNSCLQSQTLGTTWGQNQVTISSDATAAPDGTTTADKIVETAVTNIHNVDQALTITAKEFVAISGFFKAAERTKLRFRTLTNTTDELTATINLGTGVITSAGANGNAVLAGSKIVALGNGWYWVAVWGQSSTTSVLTTASITVLVHDAADTESYLGVASNGLFAWGLQFERWGTQVPGPATSYIATTTGALGRGADIITTPWPFQVQPMWHYMKYVDFGWSARANFEPAFQLTNASSNNPRLVLWTGSGNPGQTPNNRLNWGPGVGPGGNNQAVAAISTGVPVWGDTVELFARFLSGSIELYKSVNGGAITSASGSLGLGIPFVEFASPTLLYLSFGASVGLQAYKIGADPTRITTLAQAASA